jgi:hypothetical protein
MAPLRLNPLAFSPGPVSLFTVVVYLALVIPVIVIHNVVPPAPRTSPPGLDLPQAWSDLQFLSGGFHPYNSHRNDEVHAWLLRRINEIVHTTENAYEKTPDVFVFDDNRSNLTFPASLYGNTDTAVYFEGTNIIVYIRGEEDDEDNWWEVPGREPVSKGALVNAHYDSVSTGFGATDDGVGVVSCLQLLQYFTSPGHAPRKGLVVLFNNGEEDSLNGAYVYSQHPMSRFTRSFLNLEGAGAGGRATLFRSTDTEVTRSYTNAEHPFGSVLSANGFESGLIRSQTDYVVFEKLGLRGLDVAFMEPRSRYHTNRDDTRHTTMDSLWHMLSAALATTDGLVSADERSGTGNRSVWFDVFGSAFVVFRLHTLFALSVTLLIVAPLALILTSIALSRVDKMYLFRSSVKLEDGEKVGLRGLRGFFRFPLLFVIPTGVSMVLAYLLTKANPYIVHSSEYAVWSMMVTAWTFLAWFVSRVADFARPSAFHRVYTMTWMFVLTWVLQVVATVYENRFGMAGGYFIFFYYAGTSLATWISYLELFSLPRKSDYAASFASPGSRPESRPSPVGDENAEEEPTESTSLLRGQRTTFANYRVGDTEESDEPDPNVYGEEQQWSSSMPKWTWILQFIFLAPIVLILVGPLALLATSAMHQTGQDGGSSLFIYIAIAAFTTLLFSPLLPFIHRYTYHLPVFLLTIFIGTLIYNLVAFPFSDTSRLKLFFRQDLDLDTSATNASLTGIPPYVNTVITSLPSARNKDIACIPFGGRLQCSWPGLPPQLAPNTSSTDLLTLSITKTPSTPHEARIRLSGKNTRACKLTFTNPGGVNFTVADSATDPHFPYSPPAGGTRELNLWSRGWENVWTVDVEWPEDQTLAGRATCLWSDANQRGVIPALDEVWQYAPGWIAVSKFASGLVEGSKGFEVES